MRIGVEKQSDAEEITISRDTTNASNISDIVAVSKEGFCYIRARFTVNAIQATGWKTLGTINKHRPTSQLVTSPVYVVATGKWQNDAVCVLEGSSGRIMINAQTALAANSIIEVAFVYYTPL